MHHVLKPLAALLLAGLALLPVHAAPRPIRLIVTESLPLLQAHPGLDLKGTRVWEWVVGLSSPGNLYDPAATEPDLAGLAAECETAAHGAPWAVSAWCYNAKLSWDPKTVGRCQHNSLSPADWTIYVQRRGWLCAALKARGCRRVYEDWECYPLTPGGNGGSMDARAWRDGPLVGPRARAWRDASAGLPLAGWALFHDANKFPGFRKWQHAAPFSIALCEELFYGRHSDQPALIRRDYHAQGIPFLWKDWRSLGTSQIVARVRDACSDAGSDKAALYDPSGLLLDTKGMAKLRAVCRALNL
jgi:hypothetical protein